MLTRITTRFRWHAVLAASLTLHAAVLCIPLSQQFTGALATEDSPLLVTLTSTTLPVEVAATRTVSRHARKTPIPTNNQERFAAAAIKSKHSPAGQVQSEEVSTTKSAATYIQATADSPSAATENTENIAIISDPRPTTPDTRIVLAQLRDTISRESYPDLARRRGWEGEVQLGFRVEGSGAIDNIRVMHSSGNRLLDESAMRALQRIRSVPIELWLDGFSAELLLPVIYRLSES